MQNPIVLMHCGLADNRGFDSVRQSLAQVSFFESTQIHKQTHKHWSLLELAMLCNWKLSKKSVVTPPQMTPSKDIL